jgi:hypothetical protein
MEPFSFRSLLLLRLNSYSDMLLDSTIDIYLLKEEFPSMYWIIWYKKQEVLYILL